LVLVVSHHFASGRSTYYFPCLKGKDEAANDKELVQHEALEETESVVRGRTWWAVVVVVTGIMWLGLCDDADGKRTRCINAGILRGVEIHTGGGEYRDIY
jgi:hypothetical protein